MENTRPRCKRCNAFVTALVPEEQLPPLSLRVWPWALALCGLGGFLGQVAYRYAQARGLTP